MAAPTIHASAVLIGARAVLIRGASGSGKSRLALSLLSAGTTGLLPFTRLIADDRCHLQVAHGRLLVRPAETLAGLIEVHGLGIRQVPHESLAVVGLCVDLNAPDGARMPDEAGRIANIEGVQVPRLAVAAGVDPATAVLAYFTTNTQK